MSRRLWLLPFVVLFVAGPSPAHAADEAAKQAIWLLKKATLVHPDGAHHTLLRSLRQMADPQLEPLFSSLVMHSYPAMKVHGILGLAEISPTKRLDLALLADMKTPVLQAQLISAAIDADLVNDEDCQKILGWEGLDPAVKVICAAKLMGDDKKVDPAFLEQALSNENEGLKCMAALMLMQMGQADKVKVLDELNQSKSPHRDQVRLLLLQTASRYKFDKIAPWAMRILQEADVDRTLGYRALITGLEFTPGPASDELIKHFKETTNPAEKIRLALMALDLAAKLDTKLFGQLYSNTDSELIQQIARTGGMIAEKKPATADLIKLLKQYHARSSRWVLDYAKKEMDPAQAKEVYLAIIGSVKDAPPHFRRYSMEMLVLATQLLYESGQISTLEVRDLLTAQEMIPQEAMLMGLLRSSEGDSSKVIAGITDWKSDFAGSLALLLRAKHGHALNESEMKQLAIMTQGGIDSLGDPLRIQAAWVYLKLTRQDRVALASVLGNSNN